MRGDTAKRMSTSSCANDAKNTDTQYSTRLAPNAPWYTQEEINKPLPIPRKKKKPQPKPVLEAQVLTWTKPKLKL